MLCPTGFYAFSLPLKDDTCKPMACSLASLATLPLLSISTVFPLSLRLITSLGVALFNCPSRIFLFIFFHTLGDSLSLTPLLSQYYSSMQLPPSYYLPSLVPLKIAQFLLTLLYCPRPLVSDIAISQDSTAPTCQHSSSLLWPLPSSSRQKSLSCYVRPRETSLKFMAIFKLRPLLIPRLYSQTSLPSWLMIRVFQSSRLLSEITQDD